jgi:intracellular multiplication protein IcmO
MRGLEEQHELSPQLLLRDTRTLGMKTVDFFKDPGNCAILMSVFAGACFMISPLTELLGVIGVLLFL